MVCPKCGSDFRRSRPSPGAVRRRAVYCMQAIFCATKKQQFPRMILQAEIHSMNADEKISRVENLEIRLRGSGFCMRREAPFEMPPAERSSPATSSNSRLWNFSCSKGNHTF